MLPSHPLDGGRVTQVWGDWTKKAGFFVFVAAGVALNMLIGGGFIVFILACLILKHNLHEFDIKSYQDYSVYVWTIRLAIIACFLLGGLEPLLAIIVMVMSFKLSPSRKEIELYLVARQEAPELFAKGNAETSTTTKVKIKWTVLYVVLLVGLSYLLIWCINLSKHLIEK